MNCGKSIFVVLALLLLAAPARAESRTVLIQVRQTQGNVNVTIYSDDKKDRRTTVSLEEAAKAIKGMKGWGSTVGVYISSDKGIRDEELKKLHAAVKANWWLVQARGEVPRHIRDHFRVQGSK